MEVVIGVFAMWYIDLVYLSSKYKSGSADLFLWNYLLENQMLKKHFDTDQDALSYMVLLLV